MIDPVDAASSAADEIADAALALLDEVPPEPAVDPLEDAPGVDPVARALSVVGQGVYELGRGGRRPLWPTPFDALRRCDCSGFVAWCWGLDRYQPGRIGGGWVSTTGLYRDARGERRLVVEVPIANARPGDVLVYPSAYRDGHRVRVGHCALVVARAASVARCADLEVAECQASSAPAVRRRSGVLWDRRGGIVVRRVPVDRTTR